LNLTHFVVGAVVGAIVGAVVVAVILLLVKQLYVFQFYRKKCFNFLHIKINFID
jgi:uncharacterized protein (DUF2062 family)